LALLKPKDIQFRPYWNSKPSRWFAPKRGEYSLFSIWSGSQKTVDISILDEQENPIYSIKKVLHSGLNTWQWDNMLEVDMALKAEASKNEDKDKPLNKSLMPISEGLRLGHKIYIQKGLYKLVVKDSTNTESIEFEVK